MTPVTTFHQGDNGSILKFTIANKDGVVDLTGATISFVLLKGKQKSEKICTIIDANNGIIQVSLAKTDIDVAGMYFFQLKVVFNDGTELLNDISSFEVKRSL